MAQAYPAHNNTNVKSMSINTRQRINHWFIIVAEKPVNVTAKWINSSNVLVTWSPRADNHSFLCGYVVFYGMNDLDCKTFSVGVTNNTELIISSSCSSQNYSFFVVSYSNEEHTLPSEWTTLIAGNLSNVMINNAIEINVLCSS